MGFSNNEELFIFLNCIIGWAIDSVYCVLNLGMWLFRLLTIVGGLTESIASIFLTGMDGCDPSMVPYNFSFVIGIKKPLGNVIFKNASY